MQDPLVSHRENLPTKILQAKDLIHKTNFVDLYWYSGEANRTYSIHRLLPQIGPIEGLILRWWSIYRNTKVELKQNIVTHLIMRKISILILIMIGPKFQDQLWHF